MLKVLGFFDIISGIILMFSFFLKLPETAVIFTVFYLIGKGILFLVTSEFSFFSLTNFIDIAIGVLFYLSISFNIPKFLFVLASLFLLQKGIFSLVPIS